MCAVVRKLERLVGKLGGETFLHVRGGFIPSAAEKKSKQQHGDWAHPFSRQMFRFPRFGPGYDCLRDLRVYNHQISALFAAIAPAAARALALALAFAPRYSLLLSLLLSLFFFFLIFNFGMRLHVARAGLKYI